MKHNGSMIEDDKLKSKEINTFKDLNPILWFNARAEEKLQQQQKITNLTM